MPRPDLWRRKPVSPNFTPVTEAALPVNRLLDLDTGKELAGNTPALDLSAQEENGRFTVKGFGLAVSPVSEKDWGLLQLEVPEEGPEGAKIRYKLVRPGLE